MASANAVNSRGYPSSEAWRFIKPILLDLYLRQRQTLEQVQLELEARHSFVASKKSFKLKLKQWGASKNRKRQAAHSKTAVLTGEAPSFFVKARSDRPSFSNAIGWRDQPPLQSFTPAVPGPQLRDWTDRTIQLYQRLDDNDSTRKLFAAAQDFWQWTVRSSSSPALDHIQTEHLALGFNLSCTAVMLSIPASYQLGLMKLVESQEEITSRIQTSPAAVFIAILSLFTYDKWYPYPGVQDVLYNFIRAYSIRELPKGHPLKTVFEHANSDEMRRTSAKLVAIHANTLMQIQIGGCDVPDWFYWAPTLGLIQSDQLKEANDVSATRLQRAQSKVDRCRARDSILRCQFRAGDYDECITSGLAVIQTTKEILADGEDFSGELNGTYEMVAKSYAAKHDGSLAGKYYWLAFENALRQGGPMCIGTRLYHHELDKCLNDFRLWEDLTYLKSKYPFLYPDKMSSLTDPGQAREEVISHGLDQSTKQSPNALAQVWHFSEPEEKSRNQVEL